MYFRNFQKLLQMRYSLEPDYGKHAKGYSFLSFARKFGHKYGKKIMDNTLTTGKDFAKTASERLTKIFRGYRGFNWK